MNANKINLILNVFRILLVVVGVGLSLMLFSGPAVTDGKDLIEAFRESSKMNAAIYFTFFILIAAVVFVLGFFLLQLVVNPKKTIMAIIGIVISIVVYIIFYFGGTTDSNETLALRNKVSDGVILTTTAGLYTVGVILVIGVLVVIAGPLMGRYRK
jgi:drug/metabolite transporter (DMT)-like permease